VVIVLEKNRFHPGRLRRAVRDALEARQKNRVAAKPLFVFLAVTPRLGEVSHLRPSTEKIRVCPIQFVAVSVVLPFFSRHGFA
jgi:hypothetical protein